MKGKTHKRGCSQEITRFNKSKEKEYFDIKYCPAFSSEQTRSTAVTNKQSVNLKSKHKKSLSNKHGDRNYQRYLNLNNQNQCKSQNGPYSPKEVLTYFGHMLEPFERQQIKEYQYVYYIGANRQKQYHNIHKNLQNEQEIFYKYKLGDHIAYRYQIIDSINRGSFGEVLKVYDHKNKEIQALKIVKKMPQLIKQTFIEISILTNIKEKDSEDLSGIVRIKDFTIFRDHICIFFELLDANLYQLMYSNDFKGIKQSFVRVFAIQILNSLNFLYKHQIIHCDIKLQNVVLKVWGKSGVKLVDFGTSCFKDQQSYTYIQSRYYRAPQIIFQHKYSCSIDMWSFACMIAQLCLGKPLFPGTNNLHQLLYMCALLGFPDQQYSKFCYKQIQLIKNKGYLDKDSHGNIILDNVKQFQKDTNLKVQIQCLGPLQRRLGKQHLLMIHFLYQILKWRAQERINPIQALQHPWIISGLPKQMKQLHTIHQSLEGMRRNKNKQSEKVGKRKKTKSKSKSRSKEQRKKSGKHEKHKKLKNLDLKSMLHTIQISKNWQKSKQRDKNRQKSRIMSKKSEQKKKIKSKGKQSK